MTAQLLPAPIFKGWDNNGNPLANGQLFTYLAGTSTPQASYTDATQSQPQTNPVILNNRGEAGVWLDPTLVYKLNLTDSQGNQIPGFPIDGIVGGYIPVTQLSSYVTQSFIGQTLFPRTAAEIAVNITPTSYAFQPGDWRRYGADPTGVNDSTAAINASLLANDNSYGVTGTYKCSAPLVMQSGQTMYGDGSGTTLQFADGTLNNISMVGLTGSTVRDLKIAITGTNGTLKTGAVYMESCTACRVVRVEATGYNWSGIWMNQSNKCNIEDNYLHDAPSLLNTTSNGGDINLWSTSGTNASNYNVIEGNQCFGVNTAFGIMLIDPDSATATTGYPLRNTVVFNKVGTHTTYGLALYLPGAATTAADTFNAFIGNWVENITGLSSTAFSSPNTSSGAGIYCVGKGIGGTVVMGNRVTNCCSGTLLRNLAPAGVGINGVSAGVTPPLVEGNSVDSMTQGDGILITSSPGGAEVTGNSINMPSSNTGAGAGGASLLGAGIRVEASSNFVIGPNNVQVFGTGQGLFIYANGVNSDTGTITGGTYRQQFAPGGATSSSPAIQITQNGGFTPQNMTFSGVRATTANAQVANDAFSISSAINLSLAGCHGASSKGNGLLVNTSTIVRVSGGSYTTSTGSAAVTTSGPCTSGFLDEAAYTGASAALINNAGTGFTVKTRLSAVPASGTFAVGDTVFNLSPAAAGIFLWVCTTAGTPGTFKTVSNT